MPDDLCASVFADNVGQARHIAVAPDGTVYVNTWRNPYREDAVVPPGGWLIALRAADGDGVAESIERFGDDSASGVGGTGIAVHSGFLYAESNGRIVRCVLTDDDVPQGPAEVVLEGLLLEGGHTMHPFAIDAHGALFVNSGSGSNACQVEDRQAHSPGKDPCDELPIRAGLWQYDADTLGQQFSPDERFAQSLRNTVALAVHPTAGLIVLQHGRDQLHENWPELFTAEQGSELPAEMMVHPQAGDDYGWPYCYYDGFQDCYVLAPEYGGDGSITDRCEALAQPIAIYPAHWAPNALLFYTGTALPERYQGGAFIAFHGSWNRQEQQGYNVVFQPMDAAGVPNGEHEVFADGFAGDTKTPEGATHRPSGLAMAPDGALYISDDQGGRIWRIVARADQPS